MTESELAEQIREMLSARGWESDHIEPIIEAVLRERAKACETGTHRIELEDGIAIEITEGDGSSLL